MLMMTQTRLTNKAMRGCGSECRHDDGIAELTAAMSVEAVYHDAVRCISVQLLKHRVTTVSASDSVTTVDVVIGVIATIEHNESVHSQPLLGNVLHTHTHNVQNTTRSHNNNN